MLLPFRPTSDASASRNFIRSFFKAAYEGTGLFSGDFLAQELRLAEPLVRSRLVTATQCPPADTTRLSAAS